jgi:hypothetical protein
MKKIIIITFLLIKLFSFQVLAYDSSDWFNIYYQWNVNWADIYTVPEWKDLLINFLYADDVTNSELFFRDNWVDIAWWQFVENKNSVFLVITDLLQLKDGNTNNNYVITWILVNEWDDISNIITWQPEDQTYFTQEQIATLYQFEVVAVWIMWLYIFYIRVLR